MSNELSRSDLRNFGSDVATLACELVNNYGINFKLTSNNALVLYNPINGGPNLRVTSQRPEADSLRFMIDWAAKNMDKNSAVWAEMKKGRAVGNVGKALAEAHQKVNPTPAPPQAVPKPPPAKPVELVAPHVEEQQHFEEAVDRIEHDVTWTDEGYNVESLDGMFRCKTCHKPFDSHRATIGHINMAHTGSTWTPEARAKRAATKEANRQKMLRADERVVEVLNTIREEARPLLEELMESLGIQAEGSRVNELEELVVELRQKINAVEQERDQIQARLDLMREALSA